MKHSFINQAGLKNLMPWERKILNRIDSESTDEPDFWNRISDAFGPGVRFHGFRKPSFDLEASATDFVKSIWNDHRLYHDSPIMITEDIAVYNLRCTINECISIPYGIDPETYVSIWNHLSEKFQPTAFYTGGGIYISAMYVDDTHYYAMDNDWYNDGFCYYDHSDDDDPNDPFGCQNVIKIISEDDFTEEQRKIFDALKKALDKEISSTTF